MRHPGRIPILLEEIRKAWELFPEQRLCQLIVNATNQFEPRDVEDDDLFKDMKRVAETGQFHAKSHTAMRMEEWQKKET